MSHHTVIIEPGAKRRGYWSHVWQTRELLFFLTWRDITVRYKQTALGVAWAALQPLLTMAVFTVVFGKIAAIPSLPGVPYALLVMAGILPWFMASGAVSAASESLTRHTDMVTKVFFPHILLPLSAIATSLIDFLIACSLLALLMLVFGFAPSWQILFLPIFIIMGLMIALGIGLFMGAMNVSYRDFRYVVPFIIQVGMYASPVGYPSTLVPESWRWIYSLNPMVGVIDGMRWSLLGGAGGFYWPGFWLSLTIGAVLLYGGYKVFRGMERGFADAI